MRLALTELETGRLAAALSAIFAPPLFKDPQAWGASVTYALRVLVGARKAVFVIDAEGATRTHGDCVDRAVLRDYERKYAALDLGMRRQQALGAEVWHQAVLWDRELLVRSEYYNDFARPHRMHDPVGLAVALRMPRAHVRAAFFGDEPAGDPDVAIRQLALLTIVLPAFKAGVQLHLQSGAADTVPVPRGEFAPLLDAAEEAFALCDAAGRVLHANAAMAVAVETSGAPDRLRNALRDVARATTTVVRATPASAAAVRGFVTSDVHAAGADFRVRGSVVGSGDAHAAAPAVVLISLRASTPALPRADELRARFGLTVREAEVAGLLLHRNSNAQIARALSVSPHTARHHTERILTKLGVHSRAALGDAIHPGQVVGDDRDAAP